MINLFNNFTTDYQRILIPRTHLVRSFSNFLFKPTSFPSMLRLHLYSNTLIPLVYRVQNRNRLQNEFFLTSTQSQYLPFTPPWNLQLSYLCMSWSLLTSYAYLRDCLTWFKICITYFSFKLPYYKTHKMWRIVSICAVCSFKQLIKSNHFWDVFKCVDDRTN